MLLKNDSLFAASDLFETFQYKTTPRVCRLLWILPCPGYEILNDGYVSCMSVINNGL
jgi:hypothetical protein